jgi:hypothetical protein
MNNKQYVWLKIKDFARLENTTVPAVRRRVDRGQYDTALVKQERRRWVLHYDLLSEQAKAKYWQKYGRQNLDDTVEAKISRITEQGNIDKRKALEDLLYTGETGYYDKLKIAQELGVHIKTIYYWLSKSKKHIQKDIQAPIQTKKKGRPEKSGLKYPGVKERAAELFAQPYQPTATQVWEQICYELGDKPKPTLRLVQMWCRSLGLEKPAEICYLRMGEKKWADKYAPLGRDWSLVPAGDTLIGDHHEFDCFVIDPSGTTNGHG